MPDDLLNPAVLAVGLAVFVASLLLMEGGYLLWQGRFGREARRLDARLELLAGSRERAQAAVLRQRSPEGGVVHRWLLQSWGVQRLQQVLAQADLSWPPALALLASLGLGLAVLAFSLVAGRLALASAALLGLAAAAGPWAYALWRRGRRMAKLQQQLPEALDLMVRSLKAGHAFSTTLQMVADEMPEPLASEFRAVHDEVNYGLNLGQAFEHLIGRVPLTDLRYFVVAVMIQREAGGNLTELLSQLSQLIRARLRLLMRVRVLSSEGRLSGLILVLMPFALGGLLSVLNPDFMRPLWTDPMGESILRWLGGLMLLGVWIMRRIIRIRV